MVMGVLTAEGPAFLAFAYSPVMGAIVATFKEAASVYEWSPEIALKGLATARVSVPDLAKVWSFSGQSIPTRRIASAC